MLKTSHSTMEQIKIKVTLDGDLAASLLNIKGYAAEQEVLGDLIFCGHAEPKLVEFIELIDRELDIENREEK